MTSIRKDFRNLVYSVMHWIVACEGSSVGYIKYIKHNKYLKVFVNY